MAKERPVGIPGFFGGLNQSQPRELIQPFESPNMQNFTLKQGVLEKRTGYIVQAFNSGALVGICKHATMYQETGSASNFRRRMWFFSDVTNHAGSKIQQLDSLKSASNTLANITTNDIQIQAGLDQYWVTTQITDLSDRLTYLIICQNHTNPLTALNSTLNTAENCISYATTPVGATNVLLGAGGYNYTDGRRLTGTVVGTFQVGESVVQATTAAEGVVYIVESGYIVVRPSTGTFTGTGSGATVTGQTSAATVASVTVTVDPGYYAEHRAKWVAEFSQHLFMANTYEETSEDTWQALPYRVRWSNLGEFNHRDDWDEVDTDQTADRQDLHIDSGAILRMDKLRSSLMFYLQGAIVACTGTDSTSSPFRFDVMIPGIGLYAPRLLVSNGDSHFFVGSDRQIYQYFGGRDLRRIGGRIREEFFTDINKSFSGVYRIRDRSFCSLFRDIQAVGFFIPTTAVTPDRLYLYFWNDKRWEKHKLNDDVMGWGEFDRQDLGSGGYESIPLLGGGTTTEMFQWNYADEDDNNASAVAIDAWVQTKEFVIDLRNEYRNVSVWFEASGDGAASTCAVSIITQTTKDPVDSNWTTVTETIGSDWGLHHVDFNVSGYLMKLQFRNAVAGEKLRIGQVSFDLMPSARGD